MTLQDLIELLKNAAVSNYVVFVAGVIVATIGWFLSRWITKSKPSLIRVERKYASELISIAPEAKEKLQITYNGKPISELHQTIFTITNIGVEPRDIDITFYLDNFEEQDFIEATLTNAEEIQNVEVKSGSPDLKFFGVHLPFLNPRKDYEDYLGVDIFTPKPLLLKAVTGKGYGWSTQYVDKVDYINRLIRIMTTSTSPLAYLLGKLVAAAVRF